MKVSDLVPLLADVIETSSLPRSEAQRKFIAHLRLLPQYLANRRLDQWEQDVPNDSPQDHAVMTRLLENVFELGRFNLYTAFKRERTLAEYVSVAAHFRRAGLSVSEIDDITG